MDAASDAKCRLEQKQRDLARIRRENKQIWNPVYFYGEDQNWIYRNPLNQKLIDDQSLVLKKAYSQSDNINCSDNFNENNSASLLLSSIPPNDSLLNLKTDAIL